MIIGAEKVKQWLIFNDCRFWKISKSEKGDLITEFWDTDKNSNATLIDALTALETAFSLLHAGSYYITCCNDIKNQRNWKYSHFEMLKNNNENTAAIGATQFSSEDINELVNKKVNDILEERERAKKIEALEAELKELKNADNSRTDALVGAISIIQPYAEPLIGAIINALNGVGNKQIGNTNNSSREVKNHILSDDVRLKNVITSFRNIEPNNWMMLLEGIIKLKKENPTRYENAKKMLLTTKK